MSMLLSLLALVAAATDDSSVAALRSDPKINLPHADLGALESTLFDVADQYATMALTYLADHPGGHDQAAAPPAMVIIDSTTAAAAALRKIGYEVRDHESDHCMWAAGRAALAALVWAWVTLGHVETERRIGNARIQEGK